MNDKQKRLALIFAMTFVATTIILVLFNGEVIEGKAIGFEAIKEKTKYCANFCDNEMTKENPLYEKWTDCHQKCILN